jgi:hypothetical protein
MSLGHNLTANDTGLLTGAYSAEAPVVAPNNIPSDDS